MILNRILLYVFGGLALNSIFNSLAVAFGYSFPATSFLFPSDDLFADFFKTNFAIASSIGIYLDSSGLPNLIQDYLSSNAYLKKDGISFFHLPPLTMLISIGIVFLMNTVGPLPSFLLLLFLLIFVIYVALLICRFSFKNSIIWALIFLVSYPILFLITRGNLLSGLATFLIFLALILFFAKKNLLILLLLAALAINIRPNLVVLLAPIFIGGYRFRFKYIFIFSLFSVVVFFGSLQFSHSLLPEYTYSKFTWGLNVYHQLFVAGGAGVNYGSSLYGALRMLFGYSYFIELYSFLICLALSLYATLLFFLEKLNLMTYIFVLCAICCLVTPIFADYHLTIFFLPLLFLEISNLKKVYSLRFSCSKKEANYITFACTALIVPKNYAFYGGEISWQVVLNPLILLVIVSLLLLPALRRDSLNYRDVLQEVPPTTIDKKSK